MDHILQAERAVTPDSERRKVTLLFADIRGFTSLSENMRPEDVVALLNEYFERMIEVIFRNHGTLDKFLGDGLMVIFGAPEHDDHQEENAIRAALEMQAEMRALSAAWQELGRKEVRIGIGIHSGYAVVGSVGSQRRMEYTAIGDCVNLASRLESATKEFGVDILVSDFTHAAARNGFTYKALGPVVVKGRKDAVNVFAVEGFSFSRRPPPAS
ncbi:MAG: adenylate/guanylate cyclase domain-containing protein [Myxococcales bacterium]|nr:adenylate/guanylate cyclase domain-containing protein [Myxococcales bacterium]